MPGEIPGEEIDASWFPQVGDPFPASVVKTRIDGLKLQVEEEGLGI